jgi:hypothetical protein
MKNIPLIESAINRRLLVKNLKQKKELQSLCNAKSKMVSTAFSKISSYSSIVIFCNIIICCLIVLTLSACSSRGDSVAVINTDTHIQVGLSKKGTIEKIIVNGKKIEGNFNAETLLEDCDISLISSKQEDNGKYVFVKTAKNKKTGNACTITEYIYPTKNSIRWEIEIVGEKTPWSTPIVTSINYPTNENVRYWTAWGRPQIEIDKLKDTVLKKELKLMTCAKNNWLNPLIPVPFTNSQYFYGAPYVTYENPELVFCPCDFPFMKKKYNGSIISIPIVSIVDKKANYGVSFVLSPEDYTQDMTLETSEKGDIKFSRMFHRIVNTNCIKFAMDIVAHKPDWRCGLDWTSNRYTDYFEPVIKTADEMYGTGAYSNHDVVFDVEKMKKMALSVNWKASFDFPYMGMFLPPINADKTWKSFGGKVASIDEMSNYAKKMKSFGFFVLNYFNVTEFGTKVEFPAPAKSTKEGEEWKNSNDFMYKNFADAILYVPKEMNIEGCYYTRTKHEAPFYTWEDAIVLDCGEKGYSNFLLEQAQRHIDRIPDSYGFCIDRMDWLRMFNERTDDGRSWFANKPVGSLVLSWNQFMEKFGALVHKNNKVIFVNNHTKRIDLLKNTDGFFDEFTYAESPLNTTAFTAIKKPFSGWTSDVINLKEDGPDNFFQKYLYMGVFPMCPFPGNDHSIRPDVWADQQYLDYGPLMLMMKGREWVLTENPVVVEGRTAKANLFKVPDGYIVPVVFGEKNTAVIRVVIPSMSHGIKVIVQHPGEITPLTINSGKIIDGALVLTVPLKRGCAMVKIQTQG